MSGLNEAAIARRAAGQYGDARVGSNIASVSLYARSIELVFRSRLIDRLPLPALRPAHIPDVIPIDCSRSGGSRHGIPVGLLLRHQCPDDARHLVGQCHGDQCCFSLYFGTCFPKYTVRVSRNAPQLPDGGVTRSVPRERARLRYGARDKDNRHRAYGMLLGDSLLERRPAWRRSLITLSRINPTVRARNNLRKFALFLTR